jgi:hypothetical protein
MNIKLATTTLLLSLLGVTPHAFAHDWYVIPAGAMGCGDCHINPAGGGVVKDGVLNAAHKYPGDPIKGLYAFLHTDIAPVLKPISNQWDVTVGELGLTIPFRVDDFNRDTFTIKGTFSPVVTNTTISALSTNAGLPSRNLKWTPTAAQANLTYILSAYVQENSLGRSLKSNTVTAKIHVWPARTSATKNVQQFALQDAKWAVNTLTLSGLMTFKPTVTAAQRTASLSALSMSLKSNLGKVMEGGAAVKLAPNKLGIWTQTFIVTDAQVPCVIKASYEGLNAMRTVTSAPSATCLK